MKQTYQGSCHCGKIKFEADIDLTEGAGKCNCSICSKIRNWSTIVKPDAFRLLSGKEALSDYQFNTNSMHHYFCSHCGVRPFGHGDIPEVGGEFYSIQIACLDGVSDEELAAVPVRYANGRNNDWIHAPAITAYL